MASSTRRRSRCRLPRFSTAMSMSSFSRAATAPCFPPSPISATSARRMRSPTIIPISFSKRRCREAPDDQGDISAVNTFGFASTFEIVFQDSSTDTRGFNTSGADIFTALRLGCGRRLQTPTISRMPACWRAARLRPNNASPWPSGDWQAYVTALKNNPAVLKDIRIVAGFTGGTPSKPRRCSASTASNMSRRISTAPIISGWCPTPATAPPTPTGSGFRPVN